MTSTSSLVAVPISLFVLTWVFVALRFYVRGKMIRTIGPDDWTCAASLVSFTLFLGFQIATASHGRGLPRDLLSTHDAQAALEACFFAELLYTPSTVLVKASIGLLLLRLTISRSSVWLIRCIIAINVVAGIVFTLFILFQCRPTSFWWNLDPSATGVCMNTTVVLIAGYVIAAIGSITDWVFAILPMVWVWRTSMNRRTKISVSVLLGFGSLASVATLLRLPYISALRGFKGNYILDTAELGLWATVEVGVGIIAACLATLRPMLRFWLDKGKTSGGDLDSNEQNLPEMRYLSASLRPTLRSMNSYATRVDSQVVYGSLSAAGGVGAFTTTIIAGKNDRAGEGLGFAVLHTRELVQTEEHVDDFMSRQVSREV